MTAVRGRGAGRAVVGSAAECCGTGRLPNMNPAQTMPSAGCDAAGAIFCMTDER